MFADSVEVRLCAAIQRNQIKPTEAPGVQMSGDLTHAPLVIAPIMYKFRTCAACGTFLSQTVPNLILMAKLWVLMERLSIRNSTFPFASPYAHRRSAGGCSYNYPSIIILDSWRSSRHWSFASSSAPPSPSSLSQKVYSSALHASLTSLEQCPLGVRLTSRL